MDALSAQHNRAPVYFLPNVVSPVATIEERGKSLAKMLADKRKLFGKDRVHLVTHSFAGVDARAAISLYGADEDVRSLTTICTPHLGSRLVQEMRHRSSDIEMR